MSQSENRRPSTPQQHLDHYFDGLLGDLEEPTDNQAQPDEAVASGGELKSDTSSAGNINKENLIKDEPATIDQQGPAIEPKPSAISAESRATQPEPTPPATPVSTTSVPATSVPIANTQTTNVQGSDPSVPPALSKAPASQVEDSQSTAESDSAYEQQRARLEKMLLEATAKHSVPTETQESVKVEAPTIAPSLPTETTTVVETEQKTATDTVVVPNQPLENLWLDNGRPHWAQQNFDILLVDVSELTLGVPLVALGHIQPLNDELTPLFGQADWFMGLQQTPMGKLQVVDTAQLVMPERYDPECRNNYQYVLSINGLAWGLAVNDINQPISISPEAVNWRVQRSQREWMAGTIKEYMCSLLDIPALGEQLEKSDKRSKKR